jgi:hypothetical protein
MMHLVRAICVMYNKVVYVEMAERVGERPRGSWRLLGLS